MRLSTNTMYAIGKQSILDQQSRLTRIGEQLSTGQRINKPSDDPSGATQLLGLKQGQQVDKQYADNRATAQRQLAGEENQLGQVTDALGAAKQRLVQAANGTLSDADRGSLADQLDGVYQQILSAANAKNANGRYIFSGYQSDAQAFNGTAGAMTYEGDTGQRRLAVSGSREMAVNDTGDKVFASTTSNASYIATAGPGNEGSATYASLNVVDASAADYGNKFTLTFSGSGDNMTYTVTNQSLSAGNAGYQTTGDYQSGQPIALGDSMQTTIKGAPADGDKFAFAKGADNDSNILNALADTISVLRQPVDSAAAQAHLTNTLNRANRQVDNSLDNVLSVRASLGSKRNELDHLDNAGETRGVATESNISALRDADLVSTISDWSLSKVALQAAQSTFTSVQQMSLFSRG